MRALLTLLLALGSVIAATTSTAQEPARLALLIGNKGYTQKVGPLKNPHHDVDLVGASLKRLGFKVTVLKDASYKVMDSTLKRYVTEVRRAGRDALSFFYYSGHGVANPETQVNYLIPIDVADADDDKVWFESFQQNAVIDLLSKQASNATHYVVFDACRNELKLAGAAAKALGAQKGFVPVIDTSGLLVAYATAPKETASDAGVGGGPYAKVLAEELVKPGIEAVGMFRNVQIRVKQAIGQDPWLSFPSLPPVYLAGKPGAAPPQPVSPPVTQPQTSEAAQAWSAVRDTNDIRTLESFRRQYGAANPLYDRLAETRIEDLKRAQAAATTPPPARPAVPPKADPPKPAIAVSPPPATHCDGLEVAIGASERRCFRPGAGKTEQFRDCPDCPEMVVIPAGSFTMGSPDDEPGREEWKNGPAWIESPQHRVTIRAPFAVGRFAVTRTEFMAFVAATGHKQDSGCYITGTEPKPQASWQSPGFEQGNQHPVVCVTWYDAKAYVAWLSKTTGKSYRLLSESEREYVTRAGTTTPFWWGSSISTDQANYYGHATYAGGSKGEYRQKTVPVHSFEPNPWGLYQVHGNVSEWVEDCHRNTYKGAPADGSAGTAARNCGVRTLRGGTFGFRPEGLRAAARWTMSAEARYNTTGFRVARTL